MTADGLGHAERRPGEVTVAAHRASPRSRALALRARARAATLTLPTRGVSMLPALEPDATVAVEVDWSGRFGDVVAFVDAEGDIIVHRLVARFRGRILCVGDNALAFDRPVPVAQLVGRVIAPRSVAGHGGHVLHVGARHVVRLLRRPVRAARRRRTP